MTSCYGGTAGEADALLRITVSTGTSSTPASGGRRRELGQQRSGCERRRFQGQDVELTRSPARFVRVSGDAVTSGAHSVVVQYQVSNSATTFRLDDWALVVQRVRVT